MKRASRGLLIVVVAVLVMAALVWLATRSRPEPPGVERDAAGPIRFEFVGITVTSPDLEVGPAEIKGAVYSDYSSWRATMSCNEPDGCTGEFALEVDYRAGGEARRVVFINRCEAAMGGALRFEGLQDQSAPVDAIDGVTLEIRDRRGLDQKPAAVPL